MTPAASTPEPAQRGMTLVELLVVIAIIALLVGLLLPAVQSARESARRLLCANNLRQLALGTKSYEQTKGRLPPGGVCVPGAGTGWGDGYGMSWLYWVLPHIEEAPLFTRVDPTCKSAGDLDYSVCNKTVLDGVAPPVIHCPSSSMEKFSFLGTSKVKVAALNYVGIAGADGQDPKNRYGGSNVHATNGLLFAHSRVKSSAISDGTTKVMLFGEQSGFAMNAAGQPADCRAGGPHGAWLGTVKQYATQDLGDPSSNRVFNTTTIGRPLGTRTCDYIRDPPYAAPYWVGRVTNTDNRTPILSAHPGGAHVAMGDASVHFFSETIAFDVFQRLAIRDSGQVKSW